MALARDENGEETQEPPRRRFWRPRILPRSILSRQLVPPRLAVREAAATPGRSDPRDDEFDLDETGEPPTLRQRWARFFGRYVFASLSRRIVLLNLGGLLVLVLGFLYINQSRESLTDARIESLKTQAEIIAAAIASSAVVEPDDAVTMDVDRLLELQAGETYTPRPQNALAFSVNPVRVAPVLRTFISPTRTHARIFDRDGLMILDSRALYSGGQVLRFDLPGAAPDPTFLERLNEWLWQPVRRWFYDTNLPLYTETVNGDGTAYDEVVSALAGGTAARTRITANDEIIVSVAVPIQRFRAIQGVLLLSTEAGQIDEIVRDERRNVLRLFLVMAGVTMLLSVLLGSTIARPLHRLAAAADRVRRHAGDKTEIPDFTDRRDEIGNLSGALRDMTKALYARIDAIGSFAADVSHELKNPLTSLRSAVETLPLARTDEQRQRLLDVIQHDVKRLDRLISDIADASRLDAEMAKEDYEPVDLAQLVRVIHTSTEQIVAADHEKGLITARPRLVLNVEEGSALVLGHEGRLAQVITNLVENARSFLPDVGGWIALDLRERQSRDGRVVVLTIADNGPGIPVDNLERIFERFYTDRPEDEAFGQNSGLGLSIVRQIVEAHGGRIKADNWSTDIVSDRAVRRERGGAIFTVILPIMDEE